MKHYDTIDTIKVLFAGGGGVWEMNNFTYTNGQLFGIEL